MQIELPRGTNSFIRFPVELRSLPTLGRLHEVAPDVRVVLNLAAASGPEAPAHNFRDHTVEETAGLFALQTPPRGHARAAMLRAMEGHAMRRALDSSRRTTLPSSVRAAMARNWVAP
jgi:hypothetical protein